MAENEDFVPLIGVVHLATSLGVFLDIQDRRVFIPANCTAAPTQVFEVGEPATVLVLRRVEIRTEARTRSDALDLLSKRLAEMNEGRFNPDAAHTRIVDLYGDLKRDYEINGKRVKDLEKRWAHLDPVFGGDLAVAVSTPRVRQYIEGRLAEKAARGTVALELAALRRMFRLGAQADKVMLRSSLPDDSPRECTNGFLRA